ncbi:MAG: Fe(3+) ABC transporter substrate-binding protein [Thiobacillaceae bacterium]|nr:Fe(3+) ABC transporter substrate-binding protein [Thiobacillaceae bacterium]MCX7672779.1 Fe(3+) ABC transporter substrate-binding protein [Thiobacillaceae bacterium]MDW8323314.1 Fe(3+) ABC transporter substrate-binding protein [Burkholderiales bacterium]
MPRLLPALTLMTALLGGLSAASAQEQVLNLYTARHYQTDEALYTNFTKLTGIRINRIEGKEDELFERIRREGAASPADVFLTVDAARLQVADDAGLFAPVHSRTLNSRIPEQFRDPEGHWFGFSYRARVIAYDRAKVKPEEIASWADLTKPRFKGKICVRSGGHVYNRTLVASLLYHWGEDRTADWARGIVANLARDPKGGDTDQMRAVAAGECEVAITNHYYYTRLMLSNKPEDQEVVRKVGIVYPEQNTFGTHVNISGGGMLKHAPNKAAAVRFLEYLASDEAQAYFANGNNEWPVVPGVKLNNPALESMSNFKVDRLSASILAKNTPKAQRFIDRAGWK